MRRTLILLACLGLTLTACANAPSPTSDGSGSEDLVAVLQEASDRTLDAGSARMTFEFDIAAAGRTQRMNGTAEFVFGGGDPAEVEAHMTFEYPDAGQGVPGGTMEMILDRGPVIYVNADLLASMFPVETPWIKLDPSVMGEGWADVSSFGGAQADPSSTFGFLYGAIDVQEVGQDVIDGEAATHYRATVDLGAAMEQVPDAQRAAMREAVRALREQTGGDLPELPIDVWIADGLLKRMSYELSMDGVDGVEGGVSMSATLTLSDIGGSFRIDPPPADQVTDLSELAGMWGNATGTVPPA